MGNAHNWSPWHSALAENFFVQVDGRKHWSFVDPAWTAAMYPNYGWVSGPTAVQTTVDRARVEDFPLFALPQRLAKLMLKLGLMRLSVFYGLQSASAASASFRIR